MPKNNNYIGSENVFTHYIMALTKQEWKQFNTFVQSPYFNKKQQLITLYQLIDKRYPFKKGLFKTDILPVLGKHYQYPKKYQLTNKEDGMLRKLIMEFTILLQEYIIHKTSTEYETTRQRYLIDFLMTRKQHKPIRKLLQKEQQRMEKTDRKNHQFKHGQFLLAEADFFMTILSNDQKNTSKLDYLNHTFLDYFFSTVLLYYSAALNRESILLIQHQLPMANAILAHLQSNKQSFSPLTQCYYNTFLLIRDQNPEQFIALKALMINQNGFDETTQRQIYSHMLNFCSRNIRFGVLDYMSQKHEIYMLMLSGKLLSSGVYFSPQHYLLISKNALELGHIDWTWQFLNDYKSALNPKHRSQYTLVLAFYHFYDKNFSEALKCLLQINYTKDFFSILNYRILWIQIHFEEVTRSSSQQSVELALEALRQFLTKDSKMSERIHNSYLNFMRLTKRLLNFRSQPPGQRRKSILTRMIADIKEAPVLDERHWLLKKSMELLTQ